MRSASAFAMVQELGGLGVRDLVPANSVVAGGENYLGRVDLEAEPSIQQSSFVRRLSARTGRSPARVMPGPRPRTLLILLCAAALASACSSLGGSSPDDFESARSRDIGIEEMNEAIAALRRMSEFLAARPALRFEAEIHYDAIQESGQKIEFGSHRRIAIRRPDQARVEVTHRDGTRELITFDGERLSAVVPTSHAFASIEFAGSLVDALDHLVHEYGFASPLSDLLRADFADDVEARAIAGRRIGAVTIGGTLCEHLAFSGEHLDFQLFIARGEIPIPVRFVIDYHAEEGSPQFRTMLSDWELEPDLPDSSFRILPPAGAQRVPFEELLDLVLGPLDSLEDNQ